jgi:Tfp pilus assembly protein PilF
MDPSNPQKHSESNRMDDAGMELLRLLAYLHVRYGNPRSALAYLKVIDRMDPLNPKTLRSLALSYLRSGDPEMAAKAATDAASLDDSPAGHAASQLLMAHSKMHLGQVDQAQKACENFIEGRLANSA